MNNTLVVFHNADLDGLSSEAIARRALGTDGVTYLGWNYGDDIPDMSLYTRIYILDLSFPPDVMKEISPRLIWVDHHKSSLAENPTYYGGLRIDGVAACRLAWQWFFGNPKAVKADYLERKVQEPYAVQLLGEHDIFDHSNPDTFPFQYAMQATVEPNWDLLLGGGPGGAMYVDSLIAEGRPIQRYLNVTNAELAQEAGYDAVFEGLNFRVLNTPQKGSMQFDASIKDHHDGCLRYYWDGSTWGCSLYGVAHKKDIDMSVIAKKHNGGGHPGAAGCSFKTLPKELGGQ